MIALPEVRGDGSRASQAALVGEVVSLALEKGRVFGYNTKAGEILVSAVPIAVIGGEMVFRDQDIAHDALTRGKSAEEAEALAQEARDEEKQEGLEGLREFGDTQELAGVEEHARRTDPSGEFHPETGKPLGDVPDEG